MANLNIIFFKSWTYLKLSIIKKMRTIKNWLIRQLYIRLLKDNNRIDIQIVLQEMKDIISEYIWEDNTIYTKDQIEMAIGAMKWNKKNNAGRYTNKFRIITRIENIIKESK